MQCGLFYLHEVSGDLSLPLVKVRVQARLNDLSAVVALSQTYTSPDGGSSTECYYVFPVPARAAVCHFEMIKEDGTKVCGVVQEKEEAKATYDAALQEGKLAGLMIQSTPDIFRILVGNILPKEKVDINLAYVTELTEDEENDSIRLHIPSHISPRYGTPPTSPTSFASSSVTQDPFLTLECAIQSVKPIAKIGCPSHTIETELGPPTSLPNYKDLPFSNYATVKLNSNAPIDKDFILTLKADGLDSPRCIVERHPTAETIAMGLTMVPRFKLPDIPSQEFVFVIDRSGSMGHWGANSGGGRIEVAKKALVCALRSLPVKGTTFNIVSFGSTCSALWDKGSKEYNQKTLEEATTHTDGMSANMGGTELRSALEFVIRVRCKDRPTSVILLTDGDTYDLQSTAETVKQGVASASSSAYLRLFVLGIGNSASTALCESVARLGNGSASNVVDGESFTGKTNRLIKAARSPLIRDIRVDWGVGEPSEDSSVKEMEDDFEMVTSDAVSEVTMVQEAKEAPAKPKAKLSLFDSDIDPLEKSSDPVPAPTPINLPPPPPIQQSPFIIKTLSPGTRSYTYSIISPPKWTFKTPLPKCVILRGSVDADNEVELEIPVVESRSPPPVLLSGSALPPPMHTIAAKKLIQDLGDGSHAFGDSIKDAGKLDETVKAAIVRLGKTYSLASEHTSFVAVDQSDIDEKRRNLAQYHSPSSSGARYQVKAKRVDRMQFDLQGGQSIGIPRSTGVSHTFEKSKSAGGLFSQVRAKVNGLGGQAFGGAAPRAQAFAPQSQLPRGAPPPMFGAPPPPMRAARQSAAPMLDMLPDASIVPQSFSAAPAPGAAAPRFQPVATPYASARMTYKSSAKPKVEKQVGIESDADRIDALVREQSFAGSFAITALHVCQSTRSAKELLGLLPAEVASCSDAEIIAVTLFVLAYLEKRLAKERDSWEAVGEKGKDFCADALGGKVAVSVDDLMAKLAEAV